MQAMLVRRLTEPAPSARAVRPNLPDSADQAIRQALSPVAADRFATMAQFGQALQAAPTAITAPMAAPAAPMVAPAAPASSAQRAEGPVRRRKVPVTAMALLVGIFIGLGVLFAWRRAAGHGSPSEGGAARLAVLPFENLGDSADAYFAAGVSDAVRGKLTELSQLQVIARGSSVQYAGSTRTPPQIAADLGVQYLLTGTVRWAKSADGTSRVQVSPELVQVSGEGAAASKWQQSFEAPLTDVFKLQADIAGQVAQAMRVALPGAAQERLAEVPTHNPAAYDALLRARAATNYGANNAPADLRRGIAHYEEAVRLDSTFADAWAEMSTSLTVLYANSTPSPEAARRARAAAERAIAVDPRLAVGHRALGQYYLFVEADPARAAPELETAAKAAPSDAGTIALRGAVARARGRFEEALGYAREAYALDPRSGNRAGTLAQVLFWLRRPAEARPIAERALALTPGNPTAVERLVMVALSEGDLPRARQVVARATEVDPADLAAFLAVYYDLGWVLDDAGQRLVLSLGPEAFDDDPASIAIVRAQLYGWRGDAAASRAWGDSAQRHFADQIRAAPNDAQRHVLRGLALAYAGRRDEAVAEGERGVALLPMDRDAETVPLSHAPARPDLRTHRPGGAGARPAREAAGGAVLPLARLAPDRPRVRAAPREPALRAAGARDGVTADLRAALQAGLAASYALERELGRGGMATVFLAQDLKHDRPVALKVLHPELAASLGADRFLREIRLAARLQHPHILTVLDSGEVAVSGAPPFLWFTMPFIRGESLRDRLRRETQLPVEDALRIAREAADALGFAHAEGIVHRDIKPENILLTGTGGGGHALVADFGIARALGSGRDDQLTETGLTVGTPAYMSPEQASGQRELDARTDLYSLAVVLYEMLAGETPFAAPTTQATIARRFMETARPIRELRDSVPEAVERAVQRALARTAADRFGTMAQFAEALQAGHVSGTTKATGERTSAVPAADAAAAAVSDDRRAAPGTATVSARGFGPRRRAAGRRRRAVRLAAQPPRGGCGVGQRAPDRRPPVPEPGRLGRRLLRRRHHRRGARQAHGAAEHAGDRLEQLGAVSGAPPSRRGRSGASWAWTTCWWARCAGRRARPARRAGCR